MQGSAGVILFVSGLLLGPHIATAQFSGDSTGDSDPGATELAFAVTSIAPAARERVGIWFQSDPFVRPDTVVAGAALDRLAWNASPPAFPGDRPGSLTAVAPPMLVAVPT